MPDLVGEDSHTQLQVEVLRNLSSGLQGHPKNLSHAAACGAAVAEVAGQLAQVLGLVLGRVCQRSFQPLVLARLGTSSRSFCGNLDAY